mgnify:CR=1 FL=1
MFPSFLLTSGNDCPEGNKLISQHMVRGTHRKVAWNIWNFLQKRKVAYVISGIFIIISLVSLSFQGLNQGVDFVGGRSYTVRFENAVSPSEIGSLMNAEFGSAEVKTFGEDNQLKITTNYKYHRECYN